MENIGDKDMFYFEAILSEKRRIEDDIRHREIQKRNIIHLLVAFIGVLITSIGFYFSYDLEFSYLLGIFILIIIAYLLYLLDLFFAERKQLLC